MNITKRVKRKALTLFAQRSLWTVRNFSAHLFSDQLPQE